MIILEKNAEKPRVSNRSTYSRIDWNEFCPAGIYKCNENGTIQSIVDPEKRLEGAPLVWVYSSEPNFFKFSMETIEHPIIVRKDNHLWYCTFRNFKYVYKDICNGVGSYPDEIQEKELFDPNMFKYKVRIHIHNTLLRNSKVLPWMFFRDKFEPSEISEPREGARRALNASYPMYIGNNEKPVFFNLYYMGGKYYCQSISEIDPLLSRVKEIRGYEISKLSNDKMCIRYKVFDGELIVVGGYYNPTEYKRQLKEMADTEFENPEEFLEWMQKFKLYTYSIRRKYSEISQRKIEEAIEELMGTYKKDISNKILKFKEYKLL